MPQPPPAPPTRSPWDEADERPRRPHGAKVKLILEDGTAVSPPPDPELEERLDYLTENLIPGGGRSEEGRSHEADQG